MIVYSVFVTAVQESTHFIMTFGILILLIIMINVLQEHRVTRASDSTNQQGLVGRCSKNRTILTECRRTRVKIYISCIMVVLNNSIIYISRQSTSFIDHYIVIINKFIDRQNQETNMRRNSRHNLLVCHCFRY